MDDPDQPVIDTDSVRELFKGGGIDLVGTLASFGILFIGKAILSRYLDIGDFGSVALGMTVLTILGTVSLVGMEAGLTRFIPRADSPSERRDFIYSGYFIGMGASTVVATVLFLVAPLLTVRLIEGPNLTPILRIFAVALPFMSFFRLTASVTRGYERVTPKIAIRQITLPITRLVSIGIVASLALGAVAAAGAYLFSFVCASVVAAYYCYRIVDHGVGDSFSPRIRELFTFSAPLALSGAVSMILSDVDVLMLGTLKTTVSVAPYEIAFTLGNLFTLAVSSLGVIFVPMMSRYHSNDRLDGMQAAYKLSNKWTVALTLAPLLVALSYPEQVISMTFGAKYADAAATFMLLAIGFGIHASLGPNGGILKVIGATRTVLYANIATAVANVVLNLTLIPRYGIFGAAIATSSSYLLLNVLYQTAIFRSTGILPFGRELLRPIAVGVLLYVPFFATFEAIGYVTIPTILAFSVVYGISYALVQVRFGFIDEYEEVILQSIEERFEIPILWAVDRVRGK